VAATAEQLAHPPPLLYRGSPAITGNLPFYLAGAHPLNDDPRSAASLAEIAANGLLIACLDTDAACRATEAAFASEQSGTADGAIIPRFLGFSGPPISFHVSIVPARN
jgi:hypothetical protein